MLSRRYRILCSILRCGMRCVSTSKALMEQRMWRLAFVKAGCKGSLLVHYACRELCVSRIFGLVRKISLQASLYGAMPGGGHGCVWCGILEGRRANE